METVKITPTTKVEKGEDGIYIDGVLKVVKMYLVYLIAFKEGITTDEAKRVYENNEALILLARYFGGKDGTSN